MEFFTGHDVDGDGNNDLFVKHKVKVDKGTEDAVGIVVIGLFLCLIVGGLISAPVLVALLFEPSEEEKRASEAAYKNQQHLKLLKAQDAMRSRLPGIVEKAKKKGWFITSGVSSDYVFIKGSHSSFHHNMEMTLYNPLPGNFDSSTGKFRYSREPEAKFAVGGGRDGSEYLKSLVQSDDRWRVSQSSYGAYTDTQPLSEYNEQIQTAIGDLLRLFDE